MIGNDIAADCAAGRMQRPFTDLVTEGATGPALVPLDADKSTHMRTCLDWLQLNGEASSNAALNNRRSDPQNKYSKVA
ncbi:hypothetical protein [Paraburkholderia flagellata]|uniref:hypothetical protein n=1 Tax=Paraburkholderia flagellata TaxID=2883241 RepID=UPI001F1D34A9|nr:hypothetical protein [Paraburkholderia flagellata]